MWVCECVGGGRGVGEGTLERAGTVVICIR